MLPFPRVLVLSLMVALGLKLTATAWALDVDAARAHVDTTLDEVFQLVVANRPRDETAAALQRIFERRAALPELARFAAGPYWRGMSDDRRARYTQAFSRYVAFVYAGHFRRFEGDLDDLRSVVHFLRAEDAGAKGILLRSEIRTGGPTGFAVDWLVSDRSGRVAISDLIVEGVSLAITQREVIAAMLETRQGDIERLIADLERRAGEDY
ncbi:MAG TPA: ABC transporter substrate-binding protein [Thermohalobaculum sp.]|nr:ABC transporter substrate-binding protein [Thermohalobaculum sp.]